MAFIGAPDHRRRDAEGVLAGFNGRLQSDSLHLQPKARSMFERELLAGKRILVTGGGSGLGAAMGRRLSNSAPN
jgi:hypothetical protein